MKKKWIVIYATTAIICGSTIWFLYISMQPGYMGGSPPSYTLALNQTVVDNGWNLTVVSMAKPNLSASDVTYYLMSENDTKLESGILSSINGVASRYNVMWVDKDNNDLLSRFDVMFISNIGGPIGKAVSGDTFHLFVKDEHVGMVTLK